MKDAKVALASTVAERARWLLALTRRELLKGGAAVTAAAFVPALGGCSSDDGEGGSGGTGGGGPTGPETLFQHGVASGDPLPSAVMLWTRVTPDGTDPVDVSWEVASDAAFGSIVKQGSFTTNADRDFTVKVDADGLQAGTTYFYRFKAQNRTSPIGRTRTAPSGGVSRLRFALVSCSSFAHGYFHVYRAVAARPDLDAVLHLGDYIYEYASDGYGNVREYEPANEILSLSDYRTRHSQYKREPDLQEIHRQHPFIAVWDDHETANDSYKEGAENHDPATEGTWADRKANALKAYFEWMPIREAADGRIYRTLSYGDLVDLVMLDTRLWGRTLGGGLAGPPPPPDPTRTLLGDEQAAWFEGQLSSSTATWKIVGQQVMVANLIIAPGSLANLDQWHGYPESRKRLIDFLRSSNAKDVVVLTGDIHSSWAAELVNDPTDTAEYDPVTGEGAVAVEFVTPAVTSPGIPANFVALIDSALQYNPHIRYIEPSLRGYMILDVTPERTQAAWYHFDDITQATPGKESFAQAWSVKAGETRLNQDTDAALDRTDAPDLAP
jgi:alkaline phosphatase D